MGLDLPSLLRGREAVDYNKIFGDSRVVFLGRFLDGSPASQPVQQEVTDLVPTLHRLGFSHLAMEAFHSASQRAFDYYARRSIGRDDLIEQDRAWWSLTKELDDPGVISPDPSFYAPYLDVADAVIQGGLRAIGLRWCRHDGEGLKVAMREKRSQMGLVEEVWRQLEEEERQKGAMASEAYASVFDHYEPLLASHAAGILAGLLQQDPAARVAVLGAPKHYGYLSDIRDHWTVNRLLEQRTSITGPAAYFSVRRTQQSGGASGVPREGPSVTQLVAEEAVRQGVDRERFMLRTSRTEGIDMPDAIVHLPAPIEA